MTKPDERLLTDEELSEIWHSYDCFGSKPKSWHDRLSALRAVAKAQYPLAFEAGYDTAVRERQKCDIEKGTHEQAYDEGFEEGKKAQAEKDGQGIRLCSDEDCLTCEPCPKQDTQALAEAKKQGMRELAEWAERHSLLDGKGCRKIDVALWQARLKELGR